MWNAALQGALDVVYVDLLTTTPQERAQRRARKRRKYDKVNDVLGTILMVFFVLWLVMGGLG